MAKNISSILSKILPQQHAWKVKLLQNWETIIGDLKDKVRIEKISSNFIVLGVCHPAWAQELHLYSESLRKKINAVLNEDRIEQIRFKMVTLKRDEDSSQRNTDNVIKEDAKPVVNQRIRLSEKQEQSLGKIKTDGLKEFLIQYYKRCCSTNRK